MPSVSDSAPPPAPPLTEAYWRARIAAAGDAAALERERIALLGKKGALSQALRALSGVPLATRRTQGRALNALKQTLQQAMAEREAALAGQAARPHADAAMDISLPLLPQLGRVHPLSQTADELVAIFLQLGFAVEEGPEIETAGNNFTALNMPPWHPARQLHDTFYFSAPKGAEDNSPAPKGAGGYFPAPKGTDADAQHLLRTHTSPVQIRTMRRGKPPFRFIAPGRVYRCDSDQTHTPMFHQIEGLVVEDGIHLGHLRWVLEEFLQRFFARPHLRLRFRPSYFPFTEPSFEVDVQYRRDEKGGLHIGEGDAWLEILGCGMVHANVLRQCKIAPRRHQGFAFGVGIDRLAMLKYGMGDLREFFGGDLRWLRHFGFSPLHRADAP